MNLEKDYPYLYLKEELIKLKYHSKDRYDFEKEFYN